MGGLSLTSRSEQRRAEPYTVSSHWQYRALTNELTPDGSPATFPYLLLVHSQVRVTRHACVLHILSTSKMIKYLKRTQHLVCAESMLSGRHGASATLDAICQTSVHSGSQEGGYQLWPSHKPARPHHSVLSVVVTTHTGILEKTAYICTVN